MDLKLVRRYGLLAVWTQNCLFGFPEFSPRRAKNISASAFVDAKRIDRL
jgi:hypothetical protein